MPLKIKDECNEIDGEPKMPGGKDLQGANAAPTGIKSAN